MSGNIEQGNGYINQFRDILYNAGYGQEKIMSITDEDSEMDIQIVSGADGSDVLEIKNGANISQVNYGNELPLDTIFQPKGMESSDVFEVHFSNQPQVSIVVSGKNQENANKNVNYSGVTNGSVTQQINTRVTNPNKTTPNIPKTANGVNGLIDESVKQSKQGGCWLVSGVMALNATPKGKEAIKNAITVNNDGSVTVNFKGAGASYKITPEEINKYNTDNNLDDLYSNGDNDMLVLEIAAEKLRQDINSGKVNINTGSQTINAARKDINAGNASQMMYYLTGSEAKEYTDNELKTNLRGILQNALTDGNTALSFSLRAKNNSETNFSAKLINGENYSVNIGPQNGHAFAITGLTKDTVTFVNPYDTSKPCTMTWDEFEKFGVSMIASAKV